MGIITDMRRRLGLWTSSELRAEIAKANPALPSFISEAIGGGEGQGPLDQNFQMYLESPGLFHTVSACVDAISNAWAAIPLKAMRRVGDGSEEIPRHPLLDILENPNPEQGDFSFRFGIGQQIGYTGEAIVTTDNENGFTRPLTPGRDELWIQRTDRMAPVINKDAVRVGSEVNPIDHWVYNGPGGRTRFAPERVIQVKRPHPTDPWRGLSPLKQSERILSLEHQLLQTLNGFLKNGARPSSLIRMDKRPTAEDAQRFREQFRDEYSGSTNTGKPLVMWGEFDYHQLGESLLDDNVLAFLEYTRQAIMAVYKVPPLILASNDGQTWATSREQRKSFYTEAVIPLVTLVLDTLNASPLVKSFGGGVYLAADYSGVEALQPDRVAQAQADHIYVTDGTRTINEIREVREFGEPKEWGDKPVPSPLAYAYGINPFEYDVDEQLAPSAPAGDEAQAFAREIARAKARGDKGEERALRWKRFVRQTQPIERAWTRALSPLFADMRDEVLGTLDSLAGGTKASAGNGIQTKAADDPVPMGWTAAEWFNLLEALGVWEADLQNVAERTMQTGAEDILKEITGMFVPFDVDRPEVQDFINTRMATQIKTILESRQRDIVRAVTAAAETGQTIGELEKRLREMFQRDSKVWSLRIARTETAGLYNAGAQSGMEEAGVETKEWLSARDMDVRESHVAADGQVVGLREDFRLTNGYGPYPGQINSAEENINCRCTTIPGDV